ncbi:ATP-binding protein [Streptomyces sp. NPDC088557]|uniref:ATP-binding protein n=1 Tax=Streptomyces sp. NPDC088557 TaxID=3365867 RepID=UPI00380178E9
MSDSVTTARTPTLTEVAEAMGLLEWSNPADGRTVSWAFNCGADPAFREIRPCRKIAVEIAREWGQPEEVAAAVEYVVAELMTNTMQHVPLAHEIGSVTLGETPDGTLVVLVHDRSRARPYRRVDDDCRVGADWSESGRGISMVGSLCRSLAGRLDVVRDIDGRGKCVRAWLGPGREWDGLPQF